MYTQTGQRAHDVYSSATIITINSMPMDTDAGKLSASESLEIITAMIAEAKGNVRRNSFYLLFWGWVAVVANLGMYVLTGVGYPHPYAVWLITIPAWAVTFYKMWTTKRRANVVTHLDRITGRLWIIFGITIFLFALFGSHINYQINPLVLLTAAIPTMVSGTILKFRPLVVGGVFFWISGALCFLVPMQLQSLVAAAGMVCGYLIPGYMLKYRKK